MPRRKSTSLRNGLEKTLFGSPPLIEGEDPVTYDELLAEISALIQPTDILEQIWVRNVVDLSWEERRLRRLQARLMTSSASKGLREILRSLPGLNPIDDLAARWAERDASAIEQVNQLLTSAGLTMDDVMAQTFSLLADELERIDRMIARKEWARNDILREMNRRRATLRELPRAAQQLGNGRLPLLENNARSEEM